MNTDNFIWTNDLLYKFIGATMIGFQAGKSFNEILDSFKQSHTPKPQAENKPDWEIVQMAAANGGLHKLNEGGGDCSKQRCTIHSVKRLSDGEVFSVGDVIEFNVGEIRNAHIEKFEIDYFDKNQISAYHKYAGRTIKGWKKVYPPQPQKEEQGIKQWEDKFYWMGKELIPIEKVDSMCEDAFQKGRDFISVDWVYDDWKDVLRDKERGNKNSK